MVFYVKDDILQCKGPLLSKKSSPQVNPVIPPVVNKLISVQELRTVAIKHLVKLSVEHEFFCHCFFFSVRKTCHVFFYFHVLANM